MKKLLGSVLAIAMLVQPGFASAELLKNFKLGGQIDVQSSASRNVLDFVTRMDDGKGEAIGAGQFQRQYNDRLNTGQYRVVLNLDWDILDDVHARLGFRKNDRAWGTTGGTNVPGNSASQPFVGATGVNGFNGAIGTGEVVVLDQAYVKVDKIFGHVDATIGRQFYGEPGDFVIYVGPKQGEYGLATTAIDAVRVDIMSLPYINITGLAGKALGTAPGTVAGVDVDVRGLEFVLKDVENINGSVFVYNRLTHAAGPLGNFQQAATALAASSGNGGNDNLYVYGFRGKVNFGGFTGGVKFAMNGGENRQPAVIPWDGDLTAAAATANEEGMKPQVAVYQGMAFIIDAAYKADIEDVASFNPWIQFAWGTGRSSLRQNQNEGFTAIANDFRPGTIYGRFSGTSAAPLGNTLSCIRGVVGCARADLNGSGAITAADGATGVLTTPHGVPGGIAGTGLNNRVIWGVGLKTTPAFANKLEVGFSFYDFRWQRITNDGQLWFTTTDAAYGAYNPDVSNTHKMLVPNTYHDAGLVTGGNEGFGNGRGQRHIGNEIDFDLSWKHSDNVSFQAGVASFRPGKYIQEVVRDQFNPAAAIAPGARVSVNPTVLAYGDMKVRF